MSMLALPGILQQQGAGGGGGTTVYVEEDFTATTTGNITAGNLTTDELGLGWVGDDPGVYSYSGDGSGVEVTSSVSSNMAYIQTDGREDVQITCEMVQVNGTGTNRWLQLMVRSAGGVSTTDGLYVGFEGSSTDPDIELRDGNTAGTLLKTWDLSALMTTPPDSGDTIVWVMRCNGNDITLYSMQVNGGSVEVINDTYTLTGTPATDHGSGSGADFYGFYDNERSASSSQRIKSYKIESIP